jgi:hypothetical protein
MESIVMHDLAKPFAKQNLNKELLMQFLMAFSRFEYALKRARYSKQTRSLLSVDWRAFARECDGAVSGSVSDFQTQDALYLTDHPPRQQVKGGPRGVRFKSTDERIEPMVESLLEKAYGVRNNLFHGGKWAPEEEPARNDRLLRGALDVLRGALRLHPEAERYYFEPLD